MAVNAAMAGAVRRVLVTGATGLIGKELAVPLEAAGFQVYAITVDAHNPENGIHWIPGNLFDEEFVRETVQAVRPTHLLNMAWATTGDYLTSPVNEKFLAAGVNLAEAFAAAGGRRAVYAGTCFEYALGGTEPIRETDALEADKNAYTRCKHELRERAGAIFAAAGVKFGYGRIFYVYGRNEAKTRLAGAIVDRLSRGERVTISAGPLVRDYIYAKDIAGAFTALLASEVEGAVNICTGKGVAIREFSLALATALGRPELLDFVDNCAGQPPVIVGDNLRLVNEVGYRMQYSLEAAVQDIVAR